MNDTSASPTKNAKSTLHEAIDKVIDKEADMVSSISDASHKVVDSIAYRAEQIEGNYNRLLDKGRSCIQDNPFKCLGIAIAVSFILGKLLNRPRGG
jgi:ElaB/YqjD/DUF883 family membrane-anchored ribosome-binding protein